MLRSATTNSYVNGMVNPTTLASDIVVFAVFGLVFSTLAVLPIGSRAGAKLMLAVNCHLKKVFSDSELQGDSVIRKFRITATDGKSYNTNHYSLAAIIAVGYKVNSERAVQFRKWATAIDYDVTAQATKRFFATVQNKLHWAIHGQTAAEVVYGRADADKDNMGLTSWKTVMCCLWRMVEPV